MVIGTTTRVSVATGGTQGSRHSRTPAISGDGRYIAFESWASELVPGDTNETYDVFVHDRVTGATSRVSIANDGAQGDSASFSPAISGDGRYVAFLSLASNLVAGDTNATGDVFVRDRVTGATTRVSVATGGAQVDGYSSKPAISSVGRHVAFESWAPDVVAGDTNRVGDVFVHDRRTGATTRVSVATSGAQADEGGERPAISGDGRYVAFDSGESTLVAGDTNGTTDVFVHDRSTRATTRVSVATSGEGADGRSSAAAISGGGRHVAFLSGAANLVAGDTNKGTDVFVHDRLTGVTTRDSVATGGAQAGSFSEAPALSADGRYVSFTSVATLVPGDTNDERDVFVHDRVTITTTRVSVATNANQSDHNSDASAISADGGHVAFASWAGNLVAGDTNNAWDVFVRDRFARAPPTPFGDITGDGWSDVIGRATVTGSLWVYPGHDGRFDAPVRIGSGWNGMSAITRHGDFNGDGHEDIVARDRAGVLWLYPGTDRGISFAARTTIGRSGWNSMREITPVGDLTGDGRPDVLAVLASTGGLYLYPGHGTALGPSHLLGGGWDAMSELTGVGDFDRDGHPDLLARTTATGDLWLYPGTSAGFTARVRLGSGWNSMRDLVGAGDCDRDGYPDLLAVRVASGELYLYPGLGASLGSPNRFGTSWVQVQPLL